MTNFHAVERPKARKAHTCEECHASIGPGTTYIRAKGKSDGDLYDIAYCEGCWDLWHEAALAFDWYGEDSPCLGELRAALKDEAGIADPEAWAANQKAERQLAEARRTACPWLAEDLLALKEDGR